MSSISASKSRDCLSIYFSSATSMFEMEYGRSDVVSGSASSSSGSGFEILDLRSLEYCVDVREHRVE